MYWGHVLEPIIAAEYAKHTGRKVRRVNAVLRHPDPDNYWMLANLDFQVVGDDDVQVLECKTAGKWGAKLWEDGVPHYIQCQVQHQLAVTGKQAADVCVLICGQELQIHRIERDAELIAGLIELERKFWRYVELDVAPPVDGSDSSAKALQQLYPQHDDAKVVDFSEDRELPGYFEELVQTRKNLERFKAEEAKLKQKLQASMKDASLAMFASGEVSWKTSKDSTVLNTKALLKDQPALLEQYSKTRQGSRRLLVHP